MKALVNTLHPSPLIGICNLPSQFLVHGSFWSTIVGVRAPVRKQYHNGYKREGGPLAQLCKPQINFQTPYKLLGLWRKNRTN